MVCSFAHPCAQEVINIYAPYEPQHAMPLARFAALRSLVIINVNMLDVPEVWSKATAVTIL